MSQEIRGVVLELRDEKEDERRTFNEKVKDIVENWNRTTGIQVSVNFSGETPELPLRLSHDLRRIIIESLTNIERHAGASKTDLSLEYTPDRLRLQVTDNGHGFDCAADLYSFVRKGKLGLVSMKERVELVGGMFEVTTGADGTRISADVPVTDSIT
jgi:two-component system NarL family sensor kinase